MDILILGSIIAVCSMTILSNTTSSRVMNYRRRTQLKKYSIRRKSNRI